MDHRPPVRLLLCSAALDVDGGIPIVVRGLLAGMSGLPCLQVRLMTYGTFHRGSTRIGRLLRGLVQIPVLVWLVVRWRPHVVQFETAFDRKTLARDSVFAGLAQLLRRRVILHVHGGQFDRTPSWPIAWQRWARKFLLSCDAVVVASARELELLSALCGRQPRFEVVHNPVLTAPQLERQGTSRRSPDEIRVLFAGRWIPEKGVTNAIEAMKYVKSRGVRLYVFGDGPLAGEVRRLAGDSEISGRVTVMGHVSWEDLSRHHAEADIFVFLSTVPEGFPMALFSAAAFGMSIVTTAVPPIPDHMTQPENCLWVAINDPRALAACIDRLAEDPALRSAQGAHNRELAAAFEPQRTAMVMSDLYDKLLREREG